MRQLAEEAPDQDQDVQHRFGSPDDAAVSPPDRIPPVDEPRPPSLFDSPDLSEDLKDLLRNPAGGDTRAIPSEQAAAESELEVALRGLATAVREVVEKQPSWQDIRSDLLTAKLRASGFEQGPIQGSASEGHTVGVRLGKEEAMGEVFDRAVELSDDLPAHERLLAAAAPVTQALRRNLYPNVEQAPRTERFQATGCAFDPSRLPIAEVCGAPYRRYKVHEQLDRRGQPVLLIACDGSGSLNRDQMWMTKLLSSAWLSSTVGSRIQILAGLYHSGEVRRGVSGPLVQWMYHPRKTPATSRADAVRAVVTFPDSGTGKQSDALSIAFMMDEALRVARGSTVYLILISDCAWNQCFPSSGGGKAEVASCLAALQDERGDRLHVTLVAVGVTEKTGFEDQLDHVIAVSPEELEDPAAVAGRIGEYVAGCMRARRSVRELT